MHASLSYFQAVIMGLIQGVTELFPVSSLGHGVLLPALFGWHNLVNSQSQSASFFLAFLVGLHVGTAIGLLVYYRATWLDLLGGLGRQLTLARERGVAQLWQINAEDTDPRYRLLFLLAIGTIPVAIVGLVAEHKLRVLFTKPLDAAIFLCINGVILLVGERMLRTAGQHIRTQTTATLSPVAAIGIGATEILALLAGISRSGVTMVAGLSNGLNHKSAADFCFLLATPVIFLAGIFELPKLTGHLGDGVRGQTLVGAMVAGVAAYFSVRFLAKWFTTRTLWPFGIYCLAFGVICAIRFA